MNNQLEKARKALVKTKMDHDARYRKVRRVLWLSLAIATVTAGILLLGPVSQEVARVLLVVFLGFAALSATAVYGLLLIRKDQFIDARSRSAIDQAEVHEAYSELVQFSIELAERGTIYRVVERRLAEVKANRRGIDESSLDLGAQLATQAIASRIDKMGSSLSR